MAHRVYDPGMSAFACHDRKIVWGVGHTLEAAMEIAADYRRYTGWQLQISRIAPSLKEEFEARGTGVYFATAQDGTLVRPRALQTAASDGHRWTRVSDGMAVVASLVAVGSRMMIAAVLPLTPL